MPKIIELYRATGGLDIPSRFVLGAEIEEGLVVSRISFYETGAFKGDAYRGACFVVQFDGTDIRRIIPAHAVIDVAYDSELKKVKAIKAQLEDYEEEQAKTPELPDKQPEE